jgi:hypothetical protein
MKNKKYAVHTVMPSIRAQMVKLETSTFNKFTVSDAHQLYDRMELDGFGNILVPRTP